MPRSPANPGSRGAETPRRPAQTPVSSADTGSRSAETSRRTTEAGRHSSQPARRNTDAGRRPAGSPSPAETGSRPAETLRGQAFVTSRSGADRMRALYSKPTPTIGSPSHRDRPDWMPDRTNTRRDAERANDNHQDAETNSHDSGSRPETPRQPDHSSNRSGKDASHSPTGSDKRAPTNDPAASDDIDPRWLAGVPRPPDALPDDTGRAYLRWHRDRQQRDTPPSPEDHSDAEPRREKSTADRLHPYVDRPAFRDSFANAIQPPDGYGDPLRRPDGTRYRA